MVDIRLAVRALTGEALEVRHLQAALDGAPTYSMRVSGALPDPYLARDMFTWLPEGAALSDKFIFGIYRGDELIGCADVIRAFPKPATVLVGLFLLSEPNQREGLGRQAFSLLEDIVREWGTCARIRLGVLRCNEEVLPFWRKLGFEATGELKPYLHPPVQTEIIVLEKPLSIAQK
jgi:RimJ/RimL family protein N-acetyltransferase